MSLLQYSSTTLPPVDSWRAVAIVFITEKAILAMNGPQITNPDVEIIK